MRRSLILIAGQLLITSLLLAVPASGLFQVAHEISSIGQNTLVICGKNGARNVTLDRNGNPVDPANAICGHCADCSVVSVFDLPAIAGSMRVAAQERSIATVVIKTPKILRLARYQPRGPPTKLHGII